MANHVSAFGFIIWHLLCATTIGLSTKTTCAQSRQLNCNTSSDVELPCRRRLVSHVLAPIFVLPQPSNASNPTRELDFCLVALMRFLYWAESLSRRLPDQSAYLEARLGAKAALTQRLGGGANSAVYTLSSLQLKGCLNDLQMYSPSQATDLQSFTEAIASLVEFDGFDTLTDPSPRSSLTLSQYTESKGIYVRRILEEKVIPTGRSILQAFPEERRQRSRGYILQYYPNEIAAQP